MQTLPLSEAIAIGPVAPGVWSGEVSPDWAQGRAAFGGIVSGLAVAAIDRLRDPERAVRSLMVEFLAPLSPGPVRIDGAVLRAGRSLSHVRVELSQGDRLAAIILAGCGSARPSAIAVPAARNTPRPDPDTLPAFPFLEGITPRFSAGFDYRWTCTDLPFSGGDTPKLSGWVRPRDEAPTTLAALTALIDAWPAPVLSLLSRPAPASTVSWMIDVVADIPPGGWPSGTWFHFEADTVAAADGYATITGRIHDADGTLLAVSRQLVVEFSS